MYKRHPAIEKLISMVKDFNIRVHGSVSDPKLQEICYVKINIAFEKVFFNVPVADEYNDDASPNTCLLFKMILTELAMYEESEDFLC